MMKKFICLMFVFCSLAHSSFSAQSDDAARIALQPVIPSGNELINSTTSAILLSKLNQILSNAKVSGSSDLNNRFIITANASVLSKEVTPTAPPMIAYSIDLNICVGDGIDGIRFTSYTLRLKGVGETEAKAVLSAFKAINVNDKNLLSAIEESKVKIVSYYTSKCPFILKEAESLASMRKYQESIFKLLAVPSVCKACYDSCMGVAGVVYQKYLDDVALNNLNRAKMLWSTNSEGENFEEIQQLLSKVDASSKHHKDAILLAEEIKKKISDEKRKAWEFEQQKHKDAVETERQSIKAIEAVGVAYAKNQPKVVYNFRGWF